MDQKEKKECCSYDEDVMSGIKKFCADCKTTKTPLWRGGPNGPKTLCNACGIRYRKKRGSSSSCTMGMNKGEERERKRERSENVGVGDLRESLRMKLVALGEEVLLHSVQQQNKKKKKKKQRKRKNLGEEEEQAAFCLMALSSGFVFA